MRVKKVNRYYCDYCKKAGCAAGHMKAHESSCTMNPNRVCKMCKLMGSTQEPMDKLKSVLVAETPVQWNEVNSATSASVAELRKLSSGCPACMLAALRQSNMWASESDFDFKKESKQVVDYAIASANESRYGS